MEKCYAKHHTWTVLKMVLDQNLINCLTYVINLFNLFVAGVFLRKIKNSRQNKFWYGIIHLERTQNFLKNLIS